MAQGFAKLYRRFWSDEKVRQLEPEAKLVAAYVLTGQSNRIGLFRFSVGMAEDDLGIPRKRIDTVLDTVCHTLGWGLDRSSGVVWIRSWWRWNPPENEKALIGYLKDLADVPKSKLLADFRNHRDTLSDTLWDTVCNRVSMPEPYPEPYPEHDPEPEHDPQPEPVSLRASRFERPTRQQVAEYMLEIGRPDESERFCDHYDSNGWKVGGKASMKDWRASVRNWNANGYSSAKGNGKMNGRQLIEAAARLKAQEVSGG